jgi:hypothetical protein
VKFSACCRYCRWNDPSRSGGQCQSSNKGFRSVDVFMKRSTPGGRNDACLAQLSSPSSLYLYFAEAVEVALSSPSSKPIMIIWSGDRDECGAGAKDGGRAPRGAAGSRARVEKHDLIVKDHKFIAPLRCEECGGNAHLTRRSPHPIDSLETRVFECHECGHQTKQIVKP